MRELTSVALVIFEMAADEAQIIVVGKDSSSIKSSVALKSAVLKDHGMGLGGNRSSALGCVLRGHIAVQKGDAGDCHRAATDRNKRAILAAVNNGFAAPVHDQRAFPSRGGYFVWAICERAREAHSD